MSTPDRLWTLGVSGLLALGVPRCGVRRSRSALDGATQATGNVVAADRRDGSYGRLDPRLDIGQARQRGQKDAAPDRAL
jgi:hypothetical protein